MNEAGNLYSVLQAAEKARIGKVTVSTVPIKLQERTLVLPLRECTLLKIHHFMGLRSVFLMPILRAAKAALFQRCETFRAKQHFRRVFACVVAVDGLRP